ncbi:hypothetical protein DY218_28780 [Streptomyces triticagri]|uniref:Uncharacterized protein n=1 Tax=Streptomyces triticagri TaxID=2293568 RepID=A0A372LXZ1_9ACTN|nr:hypothetical protein [Streptomyces triticagri]RFU83260.1 hypothetical protein DY218_28780 [Streptomyces triticagri]
MSDGFLHWYREGWDAARARTLLTGLEAHGLRAANPATGLITAITNGPESWGEQVPTTQDDLVTAAGLARTSEINFQLWLDADTDVFTRIRRRTGTSVVVLEFGLDGMTSTEQDLVTEAVSSQIQQIRETTVGFVIDRNGISEDEDWDGVVLGEPTLFKQWPEVLALRARTAAQHPQLASCVGRHEPPLIVYTHR